MIGCLRTRVVLRLKIKPNDWLLADTCPQEANRLAYFESENELQFYYLESRTKHKTHTHNGRNNKQNTDNINQITALTRTKPEDTGLGLSLPVIFTERSKLVLLLWIFFNVLRLSLFYFLVCSLLPCGYLLGKGGPLCYLYCDVSLCFVTFPYGVSGLVSYLIEVIPDLCLPLFTIKIYALYSAVVKNINCCSSRV